MVIDKSVIEIFQREEKWQWIPLPAGGHTGLVLEPEHEDDDKRDDKEGEHDADEDAQHGRELQRHGTLCNKMECKRLVCVW